MNSPHHISSASCTPRNSLPEEFRASDAIEWLHSAILQIDTLARLASDAADEFRCPFPPTTEREFARMHILVTKVAEEARAALAEADRLMAALTCHLVAQRTE